MYISVQTSATTMAVHFEEGTEKSTTNHRLFVQNQKAAILDLGYAFTHIMSECMTEAQHVTLSSQGQCASSRPMVSRFGDVSFYKSLQVICHKSNLQQHFNVGVKI